MLSNWILALLFPVCFNGLFFFLIQFPVEASVWVSFAFINLSYLIMWYIVRQPSKEKHAAVRLGGNAISCGHFAIQFVVGLAFIIIGTVGIKAVVTTHVLLLVLFIPLQIGSNRAAMATNKYIEVNRTEVLALRNLAAQVKPLIKLAQGTKNQKAVEKVYDALCSAPTKACPQTAYIEESIESSIMNLSDAVMQNDEGKIINTVNQVLSLIDNRAQGIRNHQ